MASRLQSARIVIVLLGIAWLTSGNAFTQPIQPPGVQPPPLPFSGNAPSSQPGAPVAQPATPPSAPGGPTTLNPIFVPAPSQSNPRFNFKILPNVPVESLLPTPPVVKPIVGPVLGDDLSKIPEAEFQARPDRITPNGKLTEQTAHQLAKINHLNAKKADAFMTALLERRADLAGLPFTMGDGCRTSGERTKQFALAVNVVRQALGNNQVAHKQLVNFSVGVFGDGPTNGNNTVVTLPAGGTLIAPDAPSSINLNAPTPPPPATVSGRNFWTQYAAICDHQDAARPRADRELTEHVTLARMAALMQMLAPESAEIRLGLVKYLTGVPHVEATRNLARMAIFSAEADVRTAAIVALKVRREKDYTDVLVMGLRYPWPAIASRTADAIAQLGRTDLVPELITLLEESDPRMPAIKDVAGKKVAVVREMVKINHHRNCMMCHAPGSPETGTGNALTAEVPVPDQPLPLPSEGYRQSSPDMMIRLDVTYLRQDFSAMQNVADAHPWPELQRFDFLVRERKLTTEEASVYREKLTPREAGVLSPYHCAALAGLRELTGKDTAPTAEAWRKLLDLPATPVKKSHDAKTVGGETDPRR